MKKLNKIQENSERQFSELRNKTKGVLYQQDWNYKKEPTEVLELKN